MNAPLNPIDPTQPVAPWLGGKRNLAKRICAIIDAIPCTTYAEPFVGRRHLPAPRAPAQGRGDQ